MTDPNTQRLPQEQPKPARETNEQLRARLPRASGESESTYHARLEAERAKRAAETGTPEVDRPRLETNS
jgi:hypothetical protein